MSESQKKDSETSPFKTPKKDTKTSNNVSEISKNNSETPKNNSETPKNKSESPNQKERFRVRDISDYSEKENLKKRKLLIDEDKENCDNEFIRKEKENKMN
jgi:hypothetical protein